MHKVKKSFKVSSFQLLNAIEKSVMDDILLDPHFAIGRFECQRMVNFGEDEAKATFIFTPDGSTECDTIGEMQIECLAKEQYEYVYEVRLAFFKIDKQKQISMLLSSDESIDTEVFKVATNVKSFIAKSFADQIGEVIIPDFSAPVEDLSNFDPTAKPTTPAAKKFSVHTRPEDLLKGLDDAPPAQSAPTVAADEDFVKSLQAQLNQPTAPAADEDFVKSLQAEISGQPKATE
ncbi:MAG: hypothetical protein A2Y14_02490 [Verrucomicrobia bacterium GWF2_51_19]|nr:MAG: hypothetical protein A2Y14_02490 [Verrucomicrobia bacterium GWF2_51_19]HCJ11983.1 hypothetical protein [Opitutae bacterium]